MQHLKAVHCFPADASNIKLIKFRGQYILTTIRRHFTLIPFELLEYFVDATDYELTDFFAVCHEDKACHNICVRYKLPHLSRRHNEETFSSSLPTNRIKNPSFVGEDGEGVRIGQSEQFLCLSKCGD
jgi:hypothetical protein